MHEGQGWWRAQLLKEEHLHTKVKVSKVDLMEEHLHAKVNVNIGHS